MASKGWWWNLTLFKLLWNKNVLRWAGKILFPCRSLALRIMPKIKFSVPHQRPTHFLLVIEIRWSQIVLEVYTRIFTSHVVSHYSLLLPQFPIYEYHRPLIIMFIYCIRLSKCFRLLNISTMLHQFIVACAIPATFCEETKYPLIPKVVRK